LRAALADAIGSNKANARLTSTSGSATALAIGRGRSSRGRDGGRRRRSSAGTHTGGRITVPVGLGVAHALTNGNGGPALAVDGLEHVGSQVHCGELVDVVSNGERVTIGTS
jgi:hypothetical protein